MSDFKKQNRARWIELQNRTFGATPADTQVWTRLEDIVRVLTPFCGRNLNHMFMPRSGGLDVEGVALSHEAGCLELQMNVAAFQIVRPARVLFESFPEYRSMSYFRIEAAPLAPSGTYEEPHDQYEEVVVLSPDDYRERWVWDEQSLGEDEKGYRIPLPKSARLCKRNFSGVFALFAKGSLYNGITEAYDARHEKMNAVEFREYVQDIVTKARKQKIAE